MNTQVHTNHSDIPAQAIDTQPHDDPNGRGGEGGRKKRLARLLVAAVATIGIGAPAIAVLDAAPAQAATVYTNTYACFKGQFETGYGLQTMNMPAGVPVSVVWMYANQSQSGLYTTVYTNQYGCASVNVPAGYYWGVWVDYSTRFQTSFGWKSWRYWGGSNWQWVTANNWNYGTFYLQRSVGG